MDNMSNDDFGNLEEPVAVPQTGEPEPSTSELLVLAIDDEASMLGYYKSVLAGEGVRLETSTDSTVGLELVGSLNPDLTLLDLSMPGIGGMEVLQRIRQRDPEARVVMITGNYSIETAVMAIQAGAADYVCKPVSPEKLRQVVRDIRKLVDLDHREDALEQQLIEVFNLEGMIGRSPRMLEVFDLVRRVAPHLRTALITGETGTGKELIARALHNLSPRAQQRCAVFNCSALVDTLAESQLFGHRRGAFTGAVGDQVGMFEWADGGTVFLDEVGDLSAPSQSKLLRVLENGEVQKLGLPQATRVDVQVIAATSRDLNVEMKSNRFRPDLWYRLNMVQIHVPPLRDRREDVMLLSKHFLAHYSAEYGKELKRISRRAESALLAYSWPGNVRELQNVIARGCMLSRNWVFDMEDLPEEIRNQADGASALPSSLEEAEKRALILALAKTKNKALAARTLGISRTRLYRLMEKYGMADASPENEKSQEAASE
ncbi:MAG: sigma-54-dependent transcriptional regulator [Terriglobia bacterium]